MVAASVKPGDVLAGKYRVERVLGAGGMGYVVAARHLQLDQLVAMKFLRKGAVENSEAGARFLREAKAVVKLRNEHIAKVFDVGTLESGEPYIVMEYLEGCDLSALAKQRHVLPVVEACEYVLQACEALAEAHAIGIVHRDIKLANLFVTRGPANNPLIKVLDFGISKTNPFGESEHEMTRTASMLGSPRFMSPEQMRDPRAVDGRSDIWSLGVVLYRLIAGRPPFEADTLGRLLTMVMHEQEMPLSAVRPDLPPGFAEVVGRCLQKDPATRFLNVAELAYALVPFTMDPHRAQAAADRISAVLAHGPNTGDFSATGPMIPGPPRSSRQSTPPGASDTGTAAPWAGTHGGGPRPKPARGGAVMLGAALAVLLATSLLFVKLRATPSQQQPPLQAQPPTLTQPSPPPPTLPPAPVETATAAPPTYAEQAPPPVPNIIGASPMTNPNATVAAAPPTPPPPPRRPTPAARPPKSSGGGSGAAKASPKGGDEIPTTRD